uniref:Ribosomal protein S8 n=1 Tax=Prasinococcus sp. CCMP1194 TaxID=110672 RepID=A0A650AKJ0_9VIRI|nr:ribosomal protein S8 [Prasinococcus sp. CCMP1194]
MTFKVFAETASRLQNAVQRKHRLFSAPSSPLLRDFFSLLEKYGYVEGIASEREGPSDEVSTRKENRRKGQAMKQILIGLKYIDFQGRVEGSLTKITLYSSPSKRTAYSMKRLHQLKQTSSSSHSLHIFLTNKGMLSLDECLAQNVGGFLFCRVI